MISGLGDNYQIRHTTIIMQGSPKPYDEIKELLHSYEDRILKCYDEKLATHVACVNQSTRNRYYGRGQGNLNQSKYNTFSSKKRGFIIAIVSTSNHATN